MKLRIDLDSWCDIFSVQAERSDHVFWVSQLDYQQHLYVSSRFKQLWGQEAAVMYETPTYFDTRLISEDISDFWKKCLKRHNEEDNGSVIYQIKNEKGEPRWVKDRFMTLYDSSGEPLAAAGIAMDVTQQMDLLKDANVLKQVNEQQSQLKTDYGQLLKDKLRLLVETKQQQRPQLTSREIECLRHLSQGLSARETAERLHISRRTVEKHLDNVKLKFNCHKKVELMRILIDGNYLD